MFRTLKTLVIVANGDKERQVCVRHKHWGFVGSSKLCLFCASSVCVCVSVIFLPSAEESAIVCGKCLYVVNCDASDLDTTWRKENLLFSNPKRFKRND